MKRLAFAGLFLGTALLLTACPNESPPPPPPSTSCTPTPTGLSVQSLGSQQQTPQGLGHFSAPHVPGELLVLPGGLTPQGLAARVEGVRPLSALEGGFLRVGVPKGQERAKAEALLRAGARFVQPNYLYEPLRFPNDPLYFSHQKVQFQDLVRLESAWDRSLGDHGLVLAVVDTGYLLHADMAGRWHLPQGQNLDVADGDENPTDDTPDARAQTPTSHGLAVASVLGADTNNLQGMAGVTWAGQVLPLKVARSQDGTITTAFVADAVSLAANLGAKVINLSLGGWAYDPALESALSAARSQGAVLVAAAGNDGVDGVLYPARFPSVIAVGSVDNNKRKSSFSNCGPELDLVAPGREVVALLPNNGYGRASGTSFAAPMVAGVAALYMSAYQQHYGALPSPDRVYLCLTATAEDLGPVGHDTGYGFGLVRADRVLSNPTYCFP
ncbi:subtilisin-like serine protease [Thermus oshimai JL-2]|uniref:Subtilisin-like serine protease n=1 Tax=Thermus oshimai JL-2 TaxID=751945 RepID=K7R684_THEOS|nr:S8 family serine peptidase [Thermus oshimai]AFV76459.1 subtilisin-like serine protease [Thermus oshimai JL-2]